ncbi:MAG: hypothetical protein M3173_08415, partial [Chloroflexota bacterium]|nr:hypothetical protein [Chloroflexota bacterium]
MAPPIASRTKSQVISSVYDNQRSWVRRVGAIGNDGAVCDLFERDGVLAARTGTTGAIMLPCDTRTDLA